MGRWLASLRVRLLLLVLLTLIPVLGLLLYTSVERRREAAAEAEENALRVVRLAAVQHEQLIENARRLLRALTLLPAVRIRDGRTCNALLADVMQQHPFYTNLTAATPTGEVFCSALPLARSLSLADREWYQRLLRTGEFVVGDYELGRVSGKPMVILAHPLRDHAGQLQGLVTLGLDLSWLNQLATTVNLPQGSILLVIDRNGTILVRHPDPGKWMGRRMSEAPVVKAALAQGEEGTASLSGMDGVPRLYAFKPLGAAPNQNVTVAVGIPTEVAFAEAHRMLVNNLVWLGVVALAALGGAWLAADRLVLRPTRVLLGATQRLAAGDLTARTGLPAEGELGQLAHAFDEMAAAAAQRAAEAQRAAATLRQAHDELEQRVQERTVELSQAIQTLESQSAQLRALASELTLAEQRERQRLATVLHDEHQQLLVGVKFRLGLLERGEDPTAREACREITALLEEAIEHARALTRELSPPVLTTGGLLPALNWVVRWMAEKHQLQVDLRADETAVPDTEDLTILLFQAVRELLFNIVKHAKVGTARVELTQRDGQVHILVADTGVGFDPASLRDAGGTAGGFGLFSIRRRLEVLGGRLEIDSAPDQGSRFLLVVPHQRARAATLPVPERLDRPEGPGMAVDAPSTPCKTGKIRVLVADDHKVVRQGLSRLLAAEPDIEIVGEAADGKLAVELTHQLVPDVVLMDISMPVLNGIEATRVIHAECPAVRVIGLSMYEEAEQALAMRDAGAVAYLTKSGPAEALILAIRACAGTRRESEGREGSSE